MQIGISDLNKDFYDSIAPKINNKSDYYWHGWEKLADFLQQRLKTKESVNCLDLGCGNARFANFLVDKLDFKTRAINYAGVDFTDVNLGATLNKEYKNITASFQIQDFNANWSVATEGGMKFDLIVAFGVLHHIFDETKRDYFFEQVEKALKANDIFILTTWQFLDVPRLAKKVLSRDSTEFKEVCKLYNLEPSKFKNNDFLLDWSKFETKYRYAHYFLESEILDLIKGRGLTLVESFSEDGKTRNRNKYFVFVKNV